MAVCKVCGSDRCIGKYLLHPKEELLFTPRIEETHLKINPKRTFKKVISPSSGELFIRFKELHVIAAPDEDIIAAENKDVKIYVQDLVDQIQERTRRHQELLRQLWEMGT